MDNTLIIFLKSKTKYVDFAEIWMPYEKVDILLGAEYIEKCLLNQTLSVGNVIMRNSWFGWTAIGASHLENEREEIDNSSSNYCL